MIHVRVAKRIHSPLPIKISNYVPLKQNCDNLYNSGNYIIVLYAVLGSCYVIMHSLLASFTFSVIQSVVVHLRVIVYSAFERQTRGNGVSLGVESCKIRCQRIGIELKVELSRP